MMVLIVASKGIRKYLLRIKGERGATLHLILTALTLILIHIHLGLIHLRTLIRTLLPDLILHLHLVMGDVGRRGKWLRGQSIMGRKGRVEKGRSGVLIVDNQRKTLKGVLYVS